MQEVGRDLIVCDSRRQRAHCLGPFAAAVLRCSDGTRSVNQIAAHLCFTEGLPENEALVWVAIEELAKADLLTEAITPPRPRRSSRRKILQSAAVTLPLIESIVVPTPMSAASRGPTDILCDINILCK